MLVISSVLLTFVTAGLAIVGVLQYRTSKNQLGVMQNMIDQNERLIKASSDQASASAKSANVMDAEKQTVLDSAKAAKDSASAAKTLTEQNTDLIAAARTQANASQIAASAAETQAKTSAQALSVGERAYLAVRGVDMPKLTEGQQPVITVLFFNGGRTPASRLSFYKKIYVLGESFGGDDLDRFIREPIREPKNPDSGLLPAGEEKRVVFTADWNITADRLAAINNGGAKLFFEVEVRYVDSLDRRQLLQFCAVYNAKAGEFHEYDCGNPN
jgi:hypothetical protein